MTARTVVPRLVLCAMALALAAHPSLAAQPAFRPVVIGARVRPAAVRPGGAVAVEIAFKNLGSRPAGDEYQGFVHIEQGSRECSGMACVLDYPPPEPTTLWRGKAVVRDGPLVVNVPRDARDGVYFVHVGLFAHTAPEMPRICEARVAKITINRAAPEAQAAKAPKMPGRDIAVRRRSLEQTFTGGTTIETANLSFTVARSGRWQLTDRATGEVWRSNPQRQRFATVSFAHDGSMVALPVSPFDSIKRERDKLLLRWTPGARRDLGTITFVAQLLPDRKGLRVTWRQTGGKWKISRVRFPETAFWATGEENGYLVVPNRMGILVPASEGQQRIDSYQTYYSYGGLSMAMAGAVKNGSAVMLCWEDPYTRLDTRRSWPDLPVVPSHSMVDLTLVHESSSAGVTIRPVGRGGYVEVARTYREVARERGFLKTWRDKFASGQSPVSGCAYFRSLAFYNFAPNTRFNQTDQRKTRVGFSFAEIADTAEYLKQRLGIDRAMYVVSGWMKYGYDNQHPDVLPASAECGGNEGLAACSRHVRSLGYLFGLHDCYQDIYPDAPSWDEKLIMRNRDGTLQKGGVWFGGQSYLTNPVSAVQLARRDQNIPSVKRLFDPDFYYIDTTFAVPLHEDFSQDHPATRADDLRWKQELCRYARSTVGMFGSEEGVEWGVPVADYFESMLFQRTQRKSTEVLVPLFEMVYGDCVNIYQGDRTTTGTPGYVLDHILCAEMPQCEVFKPAEADISCSVASARRKSASTIEITYRWRVGRRAPARDLTSFVHIVRAENAGTAGETSDFSGDHSFAVPTSRWARGSEYLDGPHEITVPTDTSGEFVVLGGLLDDGRRIPLSGIDMGGLRFQIGRLSVSATGVECAGPEPSPSQCFARCDADPGISYTWEGLLANTYRIMSPLQQVTANSPMTGHAFLTSDRKVERSHFGDVAITVNYGVRPYRAGRTVLPRWGFLVESPNMLAFRADSYSGLQFAETTMIVATSSDGKPLSTTARMKFYRAYGDDCEDLVRTSLQGTRNASPDAREDVSAISSTFDSKASYPRLAVERVWVYEPKGEWTYSHHPQLGYFKGRFLAMWSNGRSDEDQPGQRVLISSSPDFLKWTTPVPLADSQPGEHGEASLAAGGFYQSDGTLIAYIPLWEYKQELVKDGKVSVLGGGHTRFRLRALTTDDGEKWSGWHEIDLPVGPNHPPRPTSSGRLIMSSGIASPYSDDPSGLKGWKLAGIYPPGQGSILESEEDVHALIAKLLGLDVPLLCEGSFFQTDDGVLHMLLRSNTEWLWVTESRDDGVTWSRPVKTGFSDNATKFHFGRLPDGRFYYVGCPAPEPRWLRSPLVLSLSDDGVRFDRHYVIADEPYTMKFPAYYKGGEYGYPSTLVRDGYLYVVVSRQKEAVEVLRAPVPAR